MDTIPKIIRQNPRTASALAFGVSITALTHVAWHANARLSGMVPALTLGAGCAHAVAGAITGARLFDPRRTRTSFHAALLGAATSLLALAIMTAGLVLFVSRTNVSQPGLPGYLSLFFFTAFFTFFAVGWAQLLVSMGVGWGLYRLATPFAGPL